MLRGQRNCRDDLFEVIRQKKSLVDSEVQNMKLKESE